jgi:hypothetical protein
MLNDEAIHAHQPGLEPRKNFDKKGLHLYSRLTGVTEVLLSQIYARQGQPERARAAAREAYKHLSNALGLQSPQTFIARELMIGGPGIASRTVRVRLQARSDIEWRVNGRAHPLTTTSAGRARRNERRSRRVSGSHVLRMSSWREDPGLRPTPRAGL